MVKLSKGLIVLKKRAQELLLGCRLMCDVNHSVLVEVVCSSSRSLVRKRQRERLAARVDICCCCSRERERERDAVATPCEQQQFSPLAA